MKIALLEPFFTGSHKAWATDYREVSRHEVEIFSLSGHHWKWRMHGGALSLARQFLESSFEADLVLATDMLDLSTFVAASRSKLGKTPVALYFHENQLTYPRKERDADRQLQRDLHYSFINFSSAAVADSVFFNSHFHRKNFLEELPSFLKRFPDAHCLDWAQDIEESSQVLPIGLDLKGMDSALSATENPSSPCIVWNHRWEYDKGPELFFNSLFSLQDKGLDFRVIIVGESFPQQPPIFETARTRLESHILHWGYASSRVEYLSLLSQGSLLPVTATQDFFGISTVEAMYAGLIPLVPATGVYSEHIPEEFHARLLYTDEEDLLGKMIAYVENLASYEGISPQEWVAGYDWGVLGPVYDDTFERIIEAKTQD